MKTGFHRGSANPPSFPRRRESRNGSQASTNALDSCFRRNDDEGAISFTDVVVRILSYFRGAEH